MERVKKGERYWSILFDRLFNDDGFCVIWRCEDWEDDVFSENRFKQHNYFYTKEEAESMARKLRAVLKGADVIEMPTAKETLKMMPDGIYTGWEKCYEFLKSKIVK